MNRQHNQRGIRRLMLAQIIITLALATAYSLLIDSRAGISALLGGVVYIVPNACFASKLFKYKGAKAARKIVNAFYLGEAIKFGLSVILFTLIFTLFKIIPLIFFGTYILTMMTHWLSPWVIDK